MTIGYEVYFDGKPLHNYCLITGVTRTVLPPRVNNSKDIPSMHGQYYTGFKYGVREIVIDAYVEARDVGERQENLYLLADVLNVSEPVKLTIGDDKDKYQYVVPKDIQSTRINNNEKLTITLSAYDVYKYATEDDFFTINDKKICTISNGGSVEGYPRTSIEFLDKAHFLQCTNYEGKTILIGQRPSTEKADSTGDTKVLVEPCESMANWTPTTNVDNGRVVLGSTGVNAGGYALYCKDYGTNENSWHGSAVRRNIGQNVENFNVRVKLEHSSKGDLKGTGATSTPPVTTPPAGSSTPVKVQYRCTADPNLRIRSGRGTQFSTLGYIPLGKVVEITEILNNWGKVTYSNVTGYCSMEYMERVTSSNTSTNKTIAPTDAVRIRLHPNTNANSTIMGIAYPELGHTATVHSESNGWYNVTCSTGVKGWTPAQYWRTVSNGRARSISAKEHSRENRLGRIEVYGYGQNGEKLFKFVIRDSEYYYEYTQPEIFIGESLVLSDGKATPTPNKSNGTEIDSGRFGDWNDFSGWFNVSRETNSQGQQVWKCSVEKLGSDGKVVKTISTNSLINSNYPKASLNHIVVNFLQHKTCPPVDVMTVNHIEVTNLKPYVPNTNRPIFWAGDELVIDHDTHKVYLNGRPFLEELDIGSEFFSVPTGESEFIFASDDSNIDVTVALTKRYL